MKLFKHAQKHDEQLSRMSIYDGFREDYDSSVYSARVINQKTFYNYNRK